MTCQNCGCTMPCSCTGYTPERDDTCHRCGYSQPCRCTAYSTEPKYSDEPYPPDYIDGYPMNEEGP